MGAFVVHTSLGDVLLWISVALVIIGLKLLAQKADKPRVKK